jgi:hypothetical protein
MLEPFRVFDASDSEVFSRLGMRTTIKLDGKDKSEIQFVTQFQEQKPFVVFERKLAAETTAVCTRVTSLLPPY